MEKKEALRGKRKKKGLYMLAGISLVIVLGIGFSLVSGLFNSKKQTPEGTEEREVWDVTKIPTELELEELMKPGVTKFYGEDEKRGLDEEAELRTIFDTNISIQEAFTPDATDMMVYTAMAFKRNPYAIKESHKLDSLNLETVRELPNNTTIDLAELVQVYSDLSLTGPRENPALFTVEGWCNGEYFTEDVDLMEWYEMNNYFQ